MTLITRPSPRRANRLGWWAGGGLLALVAAFWFAERLVDWLWMGELGYRAVFWRSSTCASGCSRRPSCRWRSYFWLNLRWALRMMEGWRRATGAPIDPALALLERSVAAAPGAAGAACVHCRDRLRRALGRRRPLPLRRAVRARGPAARPRRRLLRVSPAAARGDRARGLLRRARLLLAQAGLAVGLGVFRDWERLDDAARGLRRHRRSAGTSPPSALAPSAGYILDRFQLLYAVGRHRLGPRLRRRARGDAGALADGGGRARGRRRWRWWPCAAATCG